MFRLGILYSGWNSRIHVIFDLILPETHGRSRLIPPTLRDSEGTAPFDAMAMRFKLIPGP